MQVPPTSSRPNSGYEDLSLDDDEPAQADPWQTGGNAGEGSSRFSHHSSFSRSSLTPSFPSLGSSGRPGLDRYTSSSSAGTSTGGVGKGKGMTSTSGEVPIVLGVAVVDFNHLVGPTVEFAHPPSLQAALNDDEELNRLLPFLALPDGAHLSEEDYSYFHCVYSPSDTPPDTEVPSKQTIFGISCNRQLAAADLLRRPSDVTRSTVQKAVIVIASQPVFGPIRDRLGVLTRAFFAQRDFTQTQIIEDFYTSLEGSLEGKSGEGAIYMGTSLRELVHKFRHRTLVLLKMLMLQKRVMLFGYPVEMLCTYQYSLVSLIPGLLLNLRDSGDPNLDIKAARARPTSLRSSDRASLLRYMGLPLQLFGQDAFFQPYLPLQQVDTLKSKSWLTGTTNQIVTQQRDCKYDLLVNIENVSFEFSDPKLERIVALTSADRRWMDDIVRTVEESWEVDEGERTNFRGSDDDLRSRFEEYLCAALASIKFADFVAKGQDQGLTIVGVSGEGGVLQSFSEAWLSAFRTTKAFEIWNESTDPALFDICEPKHPCDGKVNMVSDLSLRLAEGLHDLKLDQQLAPTREVLTSAFTAGSSAFAAGSSSLFKAFDAAKNDIASRIEAERIRREREKEKGAEKTPLAGESTSISGPGSSSTGAGGGTGAGTGVQIESIKTTLGGIGSGIGNFFGSRVASLRSGAPTSGVGSASQSGQKEETKGLRPMSLSGSATLNPKRSSG